MSKPWWCFWKTRKEKEDERFKNGYLFAITRLMKGGNKFEIERYVGSSKEFGSYDNFDKGIEKALDHYDSPIFQVIYHFRNHK